MRFEPTTTGLLAALSADCGQNPGAYTIEKQRQLTELGYENGQLEAEALIQIEGPEHFSSLLLGLAPLQPHRLRMFDNWFGIRLLYQGTLFDDIEELRLTPPTLGSCEISIRGSGFGQAASSPPEGLYFNSTSFADTSITFSAKVFFEQSDGPEWRYRSTHFESSRCSTQGRRP